MQRHSLIKMTDSAESVPSKPQPLTQKHQLSKDSSDVSFTEEPNKKDKAKDLDHATGSLNKIFDSAGIEKLSPQPE